MNYKIMTPGPTQVAENVRRARSKICTNPDLDENFYDFYKETCELISRLLDTKNETIIMSGEGILGLEAACASLTENGDRILVLSNGVYGAGFADFVTLYGGQAVVYAVNDKKPIDTDRLEAFLDQDHNFKYATLVYCDTPSGMLNPVGPLCRLLKRYNILTVVDAVSAMFGEELHADDDGIDVLCGASQKALSAPPGLAFVTISEAAKEAMKNRNTPVASFYANLRIFEDYYDKKWFPYTMPISDIYGLRAALENIDNDPHYIKRHAVIGNACRSAVKKSGLDFYLESGFSNTVTVFAVPPETDAATILEKMKKDHKIMLAGSFDKLEGQVIRIGHMGTNANADDMMETLEALDMVLEQCKVKMTSSLSTNFVQALKPTS